jgi:uncharacterized protein (UPF0179 family)
MNLERINFWKRLESFIKNIQVNDCPGHEEKEMILHVCNHKLMVTERVQITIDGEVYNVTKQDADMLDDEVASLCGSSTDEGIEEYHKLVKEVKGRSNLAGLLSGIHNTGFPPEISEANRQYF